MFYYTFNSKIGWITAISSDLGILRISLPEKSSEISASQFKNEINLYDVYYKNINMQQKLLV